MRGKERIHRPTESRHCEAVIKMNFVISTAGRSKLNCTIKKAGVHFHKSGIERYFRYLKYLMSLEEFSLLRLACDTHHITQLTPASLAMTKTLEERGRFFVRGVVRTNLPPRGVSALRGINESTGAQTLGIARHKRIYRRVESRHCEAKNESTAPRSLVIARPSLR